MLLSSDDLQTLLERSGGAVHTVDDEALFCRVKGLRVEPDEFGRVMLERAELTHIDGATFLRSAHHDAVVDGVTWRVVGVWQKLSGTVVWTMEREVA